MRFGFRMIDVFGDDTFSGNPVAVVADAAGLDEEIMLRVTRWLNLSETTFILPATATGADYRVRIFTLERELPFAGHPTLGTCHAWLEAGGSPRDTTSLSRSAGRALSKSAARTAGWPSLRPRPSDQARLSPARSPTPRIY